MFLISPPFGCSTLRQLNRRRVVSNDLRYIREDCYRPRHAHLLAEILSFGIPEIGEVASPDQDREYLVGIGLVEVDERGLALAARCLVNTRNAPAHRRLLPDVGVRFGSG